MKARGNPKANLIKLYYEFLEAAYMAAQKANNSINPGVARVDAETQLRFIDFVIGKRSDRTYSRAALIAQLKDYRAENSNDDQ